MKLTDQQKKDLRKFSLILNSMNLEDGVNYKYSFYDDWDHGMDGPMYRGRSVHEVGQLPKSIQTLFDDIKNDFDTDNFYNDYYGTGNGSLQFEINAEKKQIIILYDYYEMKSEEGILADIGGASTEIVFYRQSEIVHKTSLPIGSLSLQVKYVEDILPNSDEIADMEKEVHNLLKKEDWLTKLPHYDICGIGGTFKGARSLYNILYDLTEENKEMEAEKFGRIIEKYHRERGISQEDVISLMRAVPDRINTIIPGMVIAKELALSFHSDILTYSDSGVREGYIYDQIIGKRK